MALPLGAMAACSGSSFTATGDDGPVGSSDDASGDGADDGTIIIYNDAGRDAHDATAGDAHLDAQGDVDLDGTVDASEDVTTDGPSQDGDGWAGCPTGDLTCNGQCVPNDTKNCGSCGHDCTNLAHVSGTVSCDTSSGACSFPASSCAPGWADCNGNPDDGCETSISTTQNCGGCNVTCGAMDPVCQGSGGTYSCVSGCSGNTPTLCSGSCVNTNTDPNDCKTCGNVCPTPSNGQPTCANGTCGVSCNTGYTDCSGACVDTTSNDSNCGQCGKACNGGEQCVSSTCQCTGGTHLCSGSCVANDVNACGPSCAMCPTISHGSPTCNGTSCGIQCDPSYTLCGNACDDLATDVDNCGSCGKVCPGVTNGKPTCVSSACGIVCDQGYTLCNGACYGPDTTHGVFVEQGGSTSSSCGTEALPCGTLTAAMSVVSNSNGAKTIVYIDDKSALTEPQRVNLPAGVTVEGGWLYSSGSWTYDCAPSTSPSIAPLSDYETIYASYNGTSTIENLSIESKSTAKAGESLYGVFATGSNTTLVLQNVSIRVAAGGNGTSMPAAANGTDGATSGCFTSGMGTTGPNGGVGGAGTSAYTSSGFTTAPGMAGGGGKSGDYGLPGAAGDCDTMGCNACYYDTIDQGCIPCDGSSMNICGGYGLAGCPGTGGQGGQPGTGGGASIGVFAYQATVNVTGGSISTSNGGSGGNGGAGGDPGQGKPGVPGAKACDQVNCSANKPCVSTCTSWVAGGPAGGPGGNGGSGGQGGGGPGGDSYCAVYGGGGVVYAPDLPSTCIYGSGGQLGAPNGVKGNAGLKQSF